MVRTQNEHRQATPTFAAAAHCDDCFWLTQKHKQKDDFPVKIVLFLILHPGRMIA